MQYSPLKLFEHRVEVAVPLPFNVYDHDHTLLLARGQVLRADAQKRALLTRGALIDIAELTHPADRVRLAPRHALPAMWADFMSDLGRDLLQAGQPEFLPALQSHTESALALVARDPDLAIFQLLQQNANPLVEYGVNHSVHAAIAVYLVAQRLAWSDGDALKVFKAALTMNVSMLELQGRLAEQTEPLSEAQRQDVQSHPERSCELLRLSGVSDHDWLQAVRQHHEIPGGGGYPSGMDDPSDFATLVRRADIYTAKLSPRRNRQSIAADQAGRQMFMQEPGHPMTAALVKEFGVYPPGCFVLLVNGESGVVVQRGPTVMAPVVAVMRDGQGRMTSAPYRRDTSQKAFAVRSVVVPKQGQMRLAPDQLVKLFSA